MSNTGNIKCDVCGKESSLTLDVARALGWFRNIERRWGGYRYVWYCPLHAKAARDAGRLDDGKGETWGT